MQLSSNDATMFFFKARAPEDMKKPPSKVAHNGPRPFSFSTAQIQPKYQFLLIHKILPPQAFSILTLVGCAAAGL